MRLIYNKWDTIGLKENNRFMDGDKTVNIYTEKEKLELYLIIAKYINSD